MSVEEAREAAALQPAQTTPHVPGLSYHDNFITEAEEAALLAGVHAHPAAWKTLRNRTLQNWGGLPHPKGMLPTELPAFLTPVVRRVGQAAPFDTRPNHVLVNRYAPGQGIDAHEDGPAYRPVAAVVSLGSPLLMAFCETACPSAVVARVLLRPRSLLVIAGDAYKSFLHAIDAVAAERVDRLVFNAREDERDSTIVRAERVSLTVRSCRTIRNPLLGRSRHAR